MVSKLGGVGLALPRKMSNFSQFIRRACELLVAVANYLQAPLLFALRVYFFWQLFLGGKGKLLNIERTAEFFRSINIPMPVFNAYLAGATECVGGLLLVVGLASRLVAIPVAFTMVVAYITADYEALTGIFSDPDKFVAAAPFPFLLAALLVLAFGPGAISIDALIKRFAARARPGALRL
jgi:putative oxidoreductase